MKKQEEQYTANVGGNFSNGERFEKGETYSASQVPVNDLKTLLKAGDFTEIK